jgi:hypothetical protein
VDFPQEIAKQVQQLPPTLQERVLRFVTSLASGAPVGEKGATLSQFSGSIDSDSAQQMTEAIEKECEHIDSSQW